MSFIVKALPPGVQLAACPSLMPRRNEAMQFLTLVPAKSHRSRFAGLSVVLFTLIPASTISSFARRERTPFHIVVSVRMKTDCGMEWKVKERARCVCVCVCVCVWRVLWVSGD